MREREIGGGACSREKREKKIQILVNNQKEKKRRVMKITN